MHLTPSQRSCYRETASGLLLAASSLLLFILSEDVAVNGFAPSAPLGLLSPSRSSPLFAEQGGPPQYQKRRGVLQRSDRVGEGSFLLHVDYEDELKLDGVGDDDLYQPGHVLALEIQPPPEREDDSDSSEEEEGESGTYAVASEKTRRDLENNEGWLRGPYTVSRGYGSSGSYHTKEKKTAGFQVLVKEVGYKSCVLARSKPGTPVRFGGKFHVPIEEGIRSIAAAAEASDNGDDDDDDATTKRVVMISTGVGVGPCAGAIESLLFPDEDDDSIATVAIDLIASFRTRDEVAMASDLDRLRSDSGGRFRWKAVVTGEEGRLSANGPDALRERYLQPSDRSACSVRNTHYHVIGNGQLVNEWTAGLEAAGVPSKRVTTETYFNHRVEPDPAAVDAVRDAVRSLRLRATINAEAARGGKKEPLVADSAAALERG